MLLSASIFIHPDEPLFPRPLPNASWRAKLATRRLTRRARHPRLLRRCRDLLLHHIGISMEPIGLAHHLAALDLPDLDETTALVVLLRDLQRRDDAVQREV